MISTQEGVWIGPNRTGKYRRGKAEKSSLPFKVFEGVTLADCIVCATQWAK
jgi:hypothetical protein